MQKRDQVRKEWVKNWVNVEVGEMQRRDRNDVRNQIEMYSEDLQKLNKVLLKF